MDPELSNSLSRPLRIALAGFKLESVTFLPNLTELPVFQTVEQWGADLIEQHRNANTPTGGFIAVCEREGVEMLPIVYTEAEPAGPCSEEAFDHYLKHILSALHGQNLDGVLLDLHGALVTPNRLDADRDIIAAIRREVGKKTRIMIALDYHANLDAQSIQDADAVFGYHFSPHTDQAATGERAATCMVRTLKGEINPVWHLCKPDLMVPSIFSSTDLQPLAGVVHDSIARASRSPYLDVSIFAGFSYADVPNCGFSVVAVTDGNRDQAKQTATEFCNILRENRPAFSHRDLVYGIEDGLAEARRIASSDPRPVILLEHADRLVDSTHVLRALVDARLGRSAVPFLWDPTAVATALAAGVGAQVKLLVGGFTSAKAGDPVMIEGKVVFAGPKAFSATGAYYTGRWIDLGNVVVIDTGYLVISITSRPSVAVSEDCFLQFGLKASDYDFILLRSKTHFRAVYQSICAGIVIIDTPDWGPADLTTLNYVHVQKDRTYPFTDIKTI